MENFKFEIIERRNLVLQVEGADEEDAYGRLEKAYLEGAVRTDWLDFEIGVDIPFPPSLTLKADGSLVDDGNGN